MAFATMLIFWGISESGHLGKVLVENLLSCYRNVVTENDGNDIEQDDKSAEATEGPLPRLNWQQRACCDYMLLHPGNNAEAYRHAGYKSTDPARDVVAFLKNASVREYLARERALMAKAASYAREQLVKFHVNVMETPISEVDEHSPLCQELKRTRRFKGKGEQAEEWEVETIKMPCKKGSADSLAKLLGLNAAEEFNVGASDEMKNLLLKIREGGKK